jgi:uncharacterized protein
MKIAVVGAGIAGLASAWLLDQDHEVTLFEKNGELGGHALTVHFEIDGKPVFANPAAGYITPSIYPNFLKLLRVLRVKLISIPASVTVFSTQLKRATMLTPRLSVARLAKLAHPKMLLPLLELQRALLAAHNLDEQDDWQTTLEEFLERERVSKFVREQIIFPWVSAVGEATIADIKGFSARAALKYPVHGQSGNLSQAFRLQELERGIASYIQPLLDTLRTTRVKAGSYVRGIERRGEKWVLLDLTGKQHVFDHVVLAAPAFETRRAIENLSNADSLKATLSEFKYNPARIAVHNDRTFMPPSKVDWSIYNTINNGQTCEATVWCPGPNGTEHFKSWVTFSEHLPKNTFSVHHFNHPLLTPSYYRAQAALQALNGTANLWFAGSYTQDIDSHESGLRSAIDIARQINPNSRNLKLLLS